MFFYFLFCPVVIFLCVCLVSCKVLKGIEQSTV